MAAQNQYEMWNKIYDTFWSNMDITYASQFFSNWCDFEYETELPETCIFTYEFQEQNEKLIRDKLRLYYRPSEFKESKG